MTREGQSPLLALPVDSLLSSVKQGVCKMGRWKYQFLHGDLGTEKPTPWQGVRSTHVVLLFSPKRW